MKKIFSIVMVLSLFISFFGFFLFTTPAEAAGTVVWMGTNDRGVYEGNHYFEVYFQSNDPYKDCSPYWGNNGWINIWLTSSPGVYQSYAGPSGYSNHVCQVNIYAPSGSGQKYAYFYWSNYDVLYGSDSGTLTHSYVF